MNTASLMLYNSMKMMVLAHSLRELTNTQWRDSIGPLRFAKEFQTVRIAPGRQTGKSTLLMDMYEQGDTVIVKTLNQGKHLVEGKPEFKHKTLTMYNMAHLDPSKPDRLANVDLTCNRLWVNDADCMHAHELEMIYTRFAGHCNQIILLG